ncbi:hypothetical protein SRB5_39260 [Streptomyces sp. RB5]|uniref:DNA primase/polymerase bifunctional N-terminal domain-containing protein n=1 Tax=Streptomyces smaragdinus TaxID=2585196 RepID=A0A7K0CKK5_9ACTN|nr:AAA family ATPase [Streptomyces smaragdinus]MQY13773.1 hypothetical protein [Streptomyces smaragdinus]
MNLYVPEISDEDDVMSAAFKYTAAGWYVLPVRRGSKHPGSVVKDRWQEKSSRDPEQIALWFAGTSHGLALHVGRSGAVAFDVDTPERLPELLADVLNGTGAPHQSSRPIPGRGHYLFVQPPGRRLGNGTGKLGGKWGEIRGRNGVIIAAPSQHEDADAGARYAWQATGILPVLPDVVAELLDDTGDTNDAATDAEVEAFLDQHTEAARPFLLGAAVKRLNKAYADGDSRHQATVRVLADVAREAAAGQYPARTAANELHSIFSTAMRTPRTGSDRVSSPTQARAEFSGMLAWAIAQVTPDEVQKKVRDLDARFPEPADLIAPPVEATGTEPPALDAETTSSEDYFRARVEALRAELLDTDALDKIPDLEPLVGDLLAVNTLARLVGPSGTFKSFVLLDMCGHVGTGMRWHGHYVRQGTVVYLVAEGEQGIRKRVRAWEQHHGLRMTNVLFLTRPVQAMSPEWDVLIEVMKEIKPVLIGVDTQARVSVGIEENSAKEMGLVVDRLDALRTSTGACVAVIHHTGHAGDHGRGSSSVKGALQSEIKITKKGEPLSNTVLTVKSGKQKDEAEDGDLQFMLKSIAIHGEAKPDGRPVTSLVLESLDLIPPTERPLAEGSVEWIVQQLDNANVPVEYGRRRLAEECQRLAFKASNEKLNEAARIRKNRSADRSAPPSTQPVRNSGTASQETADQTGPGPFQDRSRTSAPGAVVPSSSLGRGPRDHSGHTGPTCDVCGEPLNRSTARPGVNQHTDCIDPLSPTGLRRDRSEDRTNRSAVEAS